MNATIDYKTARQNIENEISNWELVPVNIKDIRKTGNEFHRGNDSLNPDAVKFLFNTLNIKNRIISEVKDDKKQWEPLYDALNELKDDKIVTGVRHRSTGNIIKFLNRGIEHRRDIDLSKGLDYTNKYLENVNEDLQIRRAQFDPFNLRVGLDFANPSSNIDVFGDGKDIWSTGFSVGFTEGGMQSAPFFLRLICSNGMMAMERMAHRANKDETLSERTFMKQLGKFENGQIWGAEIAGHCNRLKKNNASIHEFYGARSLLERFDEELAKAVLDDEELKSRYAACNVDITKRNSRWKATASTNINSYDLFNLLTHTATHRATEQEDISQRIAMNAFASKLLFKGPDLASVAPNPWLN
ncbi:MAG: hypothetical protein EBU90_26665 [Proteobacteria bacterium]|nr:hypothetical protein [Pseudomonadota bacterium]